MQPGDIIGTYQIAEKIGEGAMGQVFRGKDIHLDRELAIKVLRPEISSHENLVNRFRNEALTMAKLHHSNICSLYAFIEHQGEHLMVLQFVEGQTVEALVKDGGKLASDEAMRIIAEVLSGLIDAHQQGIVHRDLKPSNLMMTKSGKVVIMDFGIAKAANQVRMTRAGMMVGTLEYASPEQLRGEDVGTQSDLYSLGIVAFELLTGQLPFKAETDYEWIQAHTTLKLDTEPIHCNLGGGSLSTSLSAFIERATNKEPSKRFSSASEMLQELNGIRYSISRTPIKSLWTRIGEFSKANPVPSAAVLMTAIGLSLFLYAVIGTTPTPDYERGLAANSATGRQNSLAQPSPPPSVTVDSSRKNQSQFIAPPAPDQPFVVVSPMPGEREMTSQPTSTQISMQQGDSTSAKPAPVRPRQNTAQDSHLEREKARLRRELGLD